MIASARLVELFCAVAEAGSFTAAARELGVTQGAVSRGVKALEESLGVTLFRRTTRAVELTDAGAVYFAQCRFALHVLEEAERSLSAEQAEPAGLVRLSVPPTLGHTVVLPALAELAALHPLITLEVNVSNQNVDLVADRFDLAIRMGPLQDSTHRVRRLSDASIGVFASPRYLADHGAPTSLDALSAHRCVTFVRPSTGRPLPWIFRGEGGEPVEVAPPDTLRCSGDALGALTLARAGAGLVQSFHFLVRDDLDSGALTEVLAPFGGRTTPFSLLQPAQPGSLAARVVADFLVARCSAAPSAA